MMRFSFIPVFILALPFLEIAGFILVGQAIGLWATLGLIVATSLLGGILLRLQGTGILRRISAESRNGGVPGRDLIHAAMIVIAGFLLLLPGFITDVIGLLFFIPLVRDLAWKVISLRITVMAGAGGFRAKSNPSDFRSRRDSTVVDLDEDDFSRDPKPDSPWSDKPRIGD